MAFDFFLACCVFVSVIPHVYLIVPPKTPVLSGFEPAAIGSNRELVCDASQPDAGTITYKWYKYSVDKGVENWESKGPIGTSDKYVFNPVTEKKMFYEKNVDHSEQVSGKYKCRASNSAGTRDSEWGDLYVYTPCSLYTVSVSPSKPDIGSTFILNCYIPNPSGLTVDWLKKADASSPASIIAVANSKGCHAPDNTRISWSSSCSPPSISSKTKTFNLQVTNAQPADFAYWFCKDIGLSCDSYPVKPVVQAIPGTPQITGFPSRPVISGTQLNLKCVASPPGDTYHWYKDGTKVTTSLSYDFQVKKESAGVYTCVVRNAVGSATSSNKTKTLVVYYKSDSVVVSSGKTSSYVGEKDKFTCTVSGGYPTPNVTIYFKRSSGTPVEVSQGQDRVMTKEDNQDEYYCEAKVPGYPALDMTSSKKTYNVTFAHTKVSFLNNPTAAVQAGQVKKFTCETDESNPITYIKWYQYMGSSWRDIITGISSSERNGGYGGKIRISELSVTATKGMNGATVRCRAAYFLTGHIYSRTADSTMFVKFHPSKIIILQRPLTPIHEGKPITVVCETDSANPAANIQFHRKRTGGIWEQLTSEITPEVRAGEYNGVIRKSTLTVTANRLDTLAVFKCEVKEGSVQVQQTTTTVNIYFPPTTTISSSPNPVNEGDKLIFSCAASGGNPMSYSYKWFYNNREIPNETSKNYQITSIEYTHSGTYSCLVINYSPGGKAAESVNVDVLYRAKWNPLLPESLTVRSKVNTEVKFTLHVIANPLPSTVTWFHPNQKTAFFENFTQTKVNDTTYTLSKTSMRSSDYGNYTVNVTNAVGVSSFVFKLKLPGPPQTPCCLKKVNATAISVTLTFRSNDNGGTLQTFTIERREPGGDWIVSAKNLADPGFNKDVVQRIADLRSNRMHEFRVKAVNDDGESAYGNVLEVKTPATPNTTLTVSREGGVLTVTWTALKRSYSKVQIKYCQRKKTSKGCSYYHLKDPTETIASFDVNLMAMYDVYLEVFDGVDMVYRSAPVALPSQSGVNAGMIAGVVVTVVILIAALVAVVVVLHRRNMACFSGQQTFKMRLQNFIGRNKRKAEAVDGDIVATASGPDAVVHDTFYMNVDNKAFQGEHAPVEPVYLNDPGNQDTNTEEAEQDKSRHEVDPQRVQEVTYDDTIPMPVPSDGNPLRRIEDISVADFKQWLLSKDVTESTYKCLAKNGFKKASIFAMLQPAHIEKLQIRPLGQEVLVQNLVRSFQQETGSESGRRMKPEGDGDGEEGAYEELENPYAELNITPDVIASQTYAELKV